MTTILERTAGLLAFVRTVDAGSFAGAARLIGASPSAVSKSVARLEQRLGVRLLQRSTRTLSPASEGAAYLERYPDIKLDLSVTDRRVDLIREGFDLAIRIGELEDANLIGRSLGVLRYVLGAAPEYLQRRGMPQSIEDLMRHACLRHLLGGRPQAFLFADGTRVIPNGPFDSDDAQSLIEAVLKGVGISQFMRIAIEDELATGRLNVVLPGIPMFTTPVYVLHAFGRQLPLRARLFIDFLVEDLGTLADLEESAGI
jgi:DNA-binding transcriptional LysR family regulator